MAAPPSSPTSRHAVTGNVSPGSTLPLGSDQSSYLARCTSRISAPSGPGRQATAPAARISMSSPGGSSISGPAPALADQALLHVEQWLAVGVAGMPGPGSVASQPPRRGGVGHANVDQAAQPPAVRRVGDPDQRLHTTVQVPVHHIGAADPDLIRADPRVSRLFRIRLAGAEGV